MGVIGKLKVGSGGKLSVKSGKLSVNTESVVSGLTISMQIGQYLPSGFYQGLGRPHEHL